MKGTIVIADYGMGNIHSVRKKMNRLNVSCTVSSDPVTIGNADKIILPGVGHFAKAMDRIRELKLDETLNEAVAIRKKPILGICLGMQLMGNSSEEGNAAGLGWIDGEVKRFSVSDSLQFKVPQIGWNQVRSSKQSLLLKGIPDSSEFYFVHSYFFAVNKTEDKLCTTIYEKEYTSAIEKDNVFGVQFHPEKSHDIGLTLLNNFVNL